MTWRPDKAGKVWPPPKERILRARDIDLLPFRLEYVDETYHGWLNDGEIVKYLEAQFVDRSMTALRDYIQSVEQNPNRSFYLVVHRESGRRVGTGSLAVNLLHGTATWGNLIGDRGIRCEGISVQVLVAMFDLAFDELGVRRIYGGPYAGNVGAQFNLRRLGFVKEGVFRKHYRKAPGSDEFSDLVYYGLLAEEWRAIRGRLDPFRYAADGGSGI